MPSQFLQRENETWQTAEWVLQRSVHWKCTECVDESRPNISTMETAHEHTGRTNHTVFATGMQTVLIVPMDDSIPSRRGGESPMP